MPSLEALRKRLRAAVHRPGRPASPDPPVPADTAELPRVREPLAHRVRAGLAPAALGRHLRRSSRRLAFYVARQVPAVAAGLAASIPVLVSTVNAVRAGWEPAGDDGIILVRALDVLSAHTPLVGQYSEAGDVTSQVVHSPGPMLYWLLAIPVRLGGPSSAALAMGIVNTLAIIVCVVLARRRGGLVLMIATALGIALMCQSLTAEVFHDVWNPSAAMFPFLALVFLSWSLACGDYRLLPAVVVVASFVTQTHLTYLTPTVGLSAIGVAGLIVHRVRDSRAARRTPGRRAPRVLWRWVLIGVVAAGVCWSFPIIDEVEHSPGNLTLIARTVHDRGTTLGPRIGWNAVVRAIGLQPWWLTDPKSEWSRKVSVRTTPSSGSVDSALLMLVALAAIALLAPLRRRLDLCAAALIGLAMCLGLGANAANTPVAPLLAGTLGYTMWWGSQLGLWVWLILAWSLYCLLAGLVRNAAWPRLAPRLSASTLRLPRFAPLLAATLATLAGLGATVAVGQAVAAKERPDSHAKEYAPIAEVGRALDAAIAPHQTIDYRLGALDTATQPMEPALRFVLELHGDRVLAVGSFPRLGPYYELYDRRYDWIVYITANPASHPRHMRLVVRVHFRDRWGPETFSAWARHVPGARG
ncbi:MAG: hypothetical protein ABSG64_05580 [Solirubrobacteraceae bacterium]|jgi:hypothetical protein